VSFGVSLNTSSSHRSHLLGAVEPPSAEMFLPADSAQNLSKVDNDGQLKGGFCVNVRGAVECGTKVWAVRHLDFKTLY
jgi:hypothetical protein